MKDHLNNYICICYESGNNLIDFIEQMNISEELKYELASKIDEYVKEVSYDS